MIYSNYIAIVTLVLLSSCGTYRINKTSDFGKIGELSELNGTYRNEESEGKIKLMQFFDYEVNVDSVTIHFPNETTLVASYFNNGKLMTQELKGKRKRKFFEMYFEKKQLIIPLIYSKVSVSRLRIGRYKNTPSLLIRDLNEQNGSVFIIAGGYGGEKPYVYKNVEE